MAEIRFRAKVQNMLNTDGTVAYRYVMVPKLDRKHCDMGAFRKHPKYGPFANSDMFPAMLARVASERFHVSSYGTTIRMNDIPDGVEVDESGFLAEITITV